MGLFREFRSDKRRFIGAFVSAWCVWGVLQFTAGMILMVRYVLLHPAELPFGIRVYGFPLLTLQSGAETKFATQWDFVQFTLALNVLTLLLVGRYCARIFTDSPKDDAARIYHNLRRVGCRVDGDEYPYDHPTSTDRSGVSCHSGPDSVATHCSNNLIRWKERVVLRVST